LARILIVRGQLVNPWELPPWTALPERFEVSYLVARSNRFAEPAGLHGVRARTLRDYMPRGALGEIATGVVGDRYLASEDAFAQADIVHGAELSFWFAADAARRRRDHRFKLVQTVWETLPHIDAYRNRHAKRNRAAVLAETDLFLAATERAACALALEGVGDERIVVCPPGIDAERFAPTGEAETASEHTILSPGRLVWEKGHHDVLRAVAALHRGMVTAPGGGRVTPRLSMIGSGPEEARLRAHARELGIEAYVEIASLPYEQMPRAFARASAMVLASLPLASAAYHPFDIPHAFWEEQFGLVLAEAMAARLAIVASTSGAIPEVLRGSGATLVAPGDWMGIARALAAGPLARAPGERGQYPPELVERYSVQAAAQRLAAIYDKLLEA
jgi:glycosyltransferase involved in cell wall biosynthesis